MFLMWKMFSEKKEGLVLRADNIDESKQALFLALWPWASHLTSLCSCLCITNMDGITYLTKVLRGLKGCGQMLLIQILLVWMLVFDRIVLTAVIKETLLWLLPFLLGVQFSVWMWSSPVFSALQSSAVLGIRLGIWQTARDGWEISVFKCSFLHCLWQLGTKPSDLDWAMVIRSLGPQRETKISVHSFSCGLFIL